jgi:SpoVK/Ycf46/Vps4 family AAA+-type ATPase
MCTEAGLLALRERRMRVTQADFKKSRDKVPPLLLLLWLHGGTLKSFMHARHSDGLEEVARQGAAAAAAAAAAGAAT